ncbi:MAG: DNA-binding YbaB/EbfC family protein [Chlamydiales bacterium]|jgi:DNA-binding YbaB/EbfC family protein
MGTGFSKKKKQAKKMQEEFSRMQDEMKNTEVTGKAGNGLVEITLNGENEIKKIKINPECVDPEDVEGLEDLIKAAHNDATKQLQSQQMNPEMLGGLGGLSGLGDISGALGSLGL